MVRATEQSGPDGQVRTRVLILCMILHISSCCCISPYAFYLTVIPIASRPRLKAISNPCPASPLAGRRRPIAEWGPSPHAPDP
jgi:hypothetical protein